MGKRLEQRIKDAAHHIVGAVHPHEIESSALPPAEQDLKDRNLHLADEIETSSRRLARKARLERPKRVEVIETDDGHIAPLRPKRGLRSTSKRLRQ
jgi:hypothetical protein